MTRELRVEMRQRSRRLRGLLNLLTDDVHHVNVDAEDYDLVCLTESLSDIKETIQMIVDSVTELEYTLYLSNQHRSRN